MPRTELQSILKGATAFIWRHGAGSQMDVKKEAAFTYPPIVQEAGFPFSPMTSTFSTLLSMRRIQEPCMQLASNPLHGSRGMKELVGTASPDTTLNGGRRLRSTHRTVE